METLYHGLTETSDFTGSFSGDYVCLTRERDLALSYADEDPDRLLEVTIAASNPLVLDDPLDFRNAWLASGAEAITLAFWDAGGPYRTFLAWAYRTGHDVVDIRPGAFEGELGHAWVSSTVGEPQMVVLDKSIIVCIRHHHDPAAVPLQNSTA